MAYEGQTETGEQLTVTLTRAQADALDSVVEGWIENGLEMERDGDMLDADEVHQLRLVEAAARTIGEALK